MKGIQYVVILYSLAIVFQKTFAEGPTSCTIRTFLEVPKANANCDVIYLDNLVIPAGQTLALNPKDGARVYFRGTTLFEYAVWEGPLMMINASNAKITGEKGSVINCQGQLYWDGLGEWGSLKPKFLTLNLINSVMSDITVKNTPVHGVLVADSVNSELRGWIIDNSEGDPKTFAEGPTSCTIRTFLEVPKANANCDVIYLDNLVIPAGQTLALNPKDGARVYFRGTTLFEYAVWEGPLMMINASNAKITGEKGSVINCQGQLYWDGLGEWGSLKPKFLTLNLINSVMSDITVKNTPVHGVLVADSVNSELRGWIIDNSEGDPDLAVFNQIGHNTDGFDIWNASNLVIRNSEVYNQDDCVAIRCGVNILVENMYCRKGHGLSVSVGFSNDSVFFNTLENVTIRDSHLVGGENGIHVKTHVDSGFGIIKNVTYENIKITYPENYGIIIHENYRNLPANSTQPSEARNNIPIHNLSLKNIYGTVDDKAVPIYINCADNGCFNWAFKNVSVKGKKAKANSCNYVPKGFKC